MPMFDFAWMGIHNDKVFAYIIDNADLADVNSICSATVAAVGELLLQSDDRPRAYQAIFSHRPHLIAPLEIAAEPISRLLVNFLEEHGPQYSLSTT